MKFKERILKIVYSPVFDVVIISIVIISTAVLMIEKIFSFNAASRAFLDIFDIVVLSIFLIEFIIKISLDGGNYFIKKYGWIDLIATLPILVPVLNFIFIHFYVQFVLTKAASSTLSGLRVFRVLRIVRVIRIVRLLKLIYYFDKNSKKGKEGNAASLTVPALSVLLFVILSYIVILYQENTMVSRTVKNDTALMNIITPSNINDIFTVNQDILIYYKNDIIKRRISDAALMNRYANDEYIYLSDKDKNFMVVSIKDNIDILKFHELFIIIIEILLIISFMLYSRKPIISGKLGD